MNIKEQQEFNRLNKSFPLDFVNCDIALNVNTVDGLPLNKWVIIDKSKGGINYAFKSIHSIYVYTGRLCSSSFMDFSSNSPMVLLSFSVTAFNKLFSSSPLLYL